MQKCLSCKPDFSVRSAVISRSSRFQFPSLWKCERSQKICTTKQVQSLHCQGWANCGIPTSAHLPSICAGSVTERSQEVWTSKEVQSLQCQGWDNSESPDEPIFHQSVTAQLLCVQSSTWFAHAKSLFARLQWEGDRKRLCHRDDLVTNEFY